MTRPTFLLLALLALPACPGFVNAVAACAGEVAPAVLGEVRGALSDPQWGGGSALDRLFRTLGSVVVCAVRQIAAEKPRPHLGAASRPDLRPERAREWLRTRGFATGASASGRP